MTLGNCSALLTVPDTIFFLNDVIMTTQVRNEARGLSGLDSIKVLLKYKEKPEFNLVLVCNPSRPFFISLGNHVSFQIVFFLIATPD